MLAKKHGVYGFCYHHYWFDGKELLQKPIQEILRTTKPDFPFCICWANENWTRCWDGKDKEILIKQDHSVENDNRFIDHLLNVFSDERYIKIDGKPLLLVYKISLLANPRKTISYWRKCCSDAGLNGLYVCAVDYFVHKAPGKYGVDAFVEFAPHGLHDQSMDCSGEVEITNPNYHGTMRDMESVVIRSLLKKRPKFTYYRGLMPSWDNTPRRQDNGVTFINSSPALFEFWYNEIVQQVVDDREDNKLVFINAWNEWAEGCHLEPDNKYGTSYLRVIKNVNSFYNNRRTDDCTKTYRYIFNDSDMYRRMVNKALHMVETQKLLARIVSRLKNEIRKHKNMHRFVLRVWAIGKK